MSRSFGANESGPPKRARPITKKLISGPKNPSSLPRYHNINETLAHTQSFHHVSLRVRNIINMT